MSIGRLTHLPSRGIRLPKPRIEDDLENKPWMPHGMAAINGRSSPLVQPCMKINIFLHHITLSEILHEIIELSYASRPPIPNERLLQLHQQLLKWHRDLPDALQMRQGSLILPQILTLQ